VFLDYDEVWATRWTYGAETMEVWDSDCFIAGFLRPLEPRKVDSEDCNHQME
jgi:hypothetical protein